MAKKYQMMRCRTCGLPRIVGFFVKWNDNGTITQFMNRDFKVVALHHGFLDNLFSHIEAHLGLPVEHIAFEAQRKASSAVFQAFYDRLPGIRLATRLKFVRRMGVEQFNKVATITGQCHSQTLEYVPGSYGVARMRNPFHLHLMAANVVGAFETLEGVPFRHSWEEEQGDSFVIRVEATGKKPEIAERLELERIRILPPMGFKHERCPRCKAPLALSHLQWLENEGIILDNRTGARVILLDGYMVTTVFRELARELGDEMYGLMVEAQRDWTVEHVEQLGLVEGQGNGPLSSFELEKGYREYLSLLPLYGQGNPVRLEMKNSRVLVTVENPYERNILAGTLRGLYEALEQTGSKVMWTEDREGAVSYTVEPA